MRSYHVPVNVLVDNKYGSRNAAKKCIMVWNGLFANMVTNSFFNLINTVNPFNMDY